MAVHNLGENVKTGIAIVPSDEGAGEVVGPVVDRKGFYGAVFTCLSGDSTGTHGAEAIVFKVTECDTSGGTYTDVSGATVTLDTENTSGEINVDLNSRQRYLKLVATTAFDTATAWEQGGSYTLGLPNVGGV